MRPRVLRFLILMAAFAGAAHAQGVSIAAPPDRFVAPGGFATLVFRVAAVFETDVEIAVTVDAGWRVLRPPERRTLEGGRSTPIAITIEVPSAAAAGTRGEVRFVVDAAEGSVERVVALTVTERVDVGLQAPAEHTIGGDGLEVVVTNGGNVAERAALELRRDGVLLDRRELVLAPDARQLVRFEPTDEGLHQVVLMTERGDEVRRSVRVLRFGTGLDVPYVLAGEVGATVGTSGRNAFVVGLRGAVSDFVTVEARVDAAAWSRSYAVAEEATWSVRLGAGWRDPFGLTLPSDPGVSARWAGGAWGVAAHAGWAGDDRYGGSVSVGWASGGTTVAGGLGVRGGVPTVALRGTATPSAGVDLVATAGLRDGAVGASLRADVDEGGTHTRLVLTGHDLTGAASRVDLSARLRAGPAEVYADGTVPLGASAAWAGRLGFRDTPTTPLAGTVEIAVQAGTGASFARVGYRGEVGAGWRAGTTGGVRVDEGGFGVTFDASIARAGTDPIDLDARLDYRPATGRIGGRVGAQARFAADPVDVALAFGWDLGERDVATGAVIAWSDGPWSWELDATLGLGYPTEAASRWRADVALSSAYAFDLPVPEPLVEAAGGRRSGVLVGRAATATGEPLPGVVVRVGRFRAVTDEAGAYRLELQPGRYEVEVDVTSVPITYRLVAETRAPVEVGLRTTTTFDVPVARTTVLRGRLLEDRDGDGVVDDAARPVAARVRVTDADGVGRSVAVDAAGGFELRGLPAGPARIEVFDLPLGASVVGEATRVLVLEPGVPAEVTILVRPVPAQVATFGGGALRVRAVRAEVGRVPPGAAPRVRVEVAGDADEVALEVDGERVPLVRDGDAWVGRVTVPTSAGAGVWPYVVVARSGDDVAERRDQLIVDPDAPLFEASSDGPVRAGSNLRIDVVVYASAASVTVEGPFGVLALADGEPGRWTGALSVPADAPDAVVELALTVRTVDGLVATAPLRFRVLEP